MFIRSERHQQSSHSGLRQCLVSADKEKLLRPARLGSGSGVGGGDGGVHLLTIPTGTMPQQETKADHIFLIPRKKIRDAAAFMMMMILIHLRRLWLLLLLLLLSSSLPLRMVLKADSDLTITGTATEADVLMPLYSDCLCGSC